ncbi:hypothetical protein I302_109172 [Kwoniella bestiolae CBS 10118]|uniref:Cell division control protein 14 n=1 Tax=Kwoniella bestiolae CBS 10118 TaxID=1296100 RepID=A0A1B9FV69_9TREE|nr:hypothetical protein I302_08318 [Kwoniella bestiolae CBS 10118]OCF22667.1 hypothetical protein I302_08318 [Kwoniella bestiolae CBS 10118]
MSRPQGHRKSQSTSALSFLASHSSSSSFSSSSSSHTPQIPRIKDTPSASEARKYRSRQSQSHLPSVNESEPSDSASMPALPGLTTTPSPGTPGGEGMRRTKSNQSHISGRDRDRRRSKSHSAAEVERMKKSEVMGVGMRKERSVDEGLDGWLSDIKSLRSSSRLRLSALKRVERYLVEICLSKDDLKLEDLLSKQIHQTLLSLLTRHTSTLSQKSSHTSLPANDETAVGLIPELEVVASILQGLCCLSRRCKEMVGESWVMEMFIDLLLLLRSQLPITEISKAIAYTILELLFCILVDSPKNARTYEKLGGLEAVTRVLKGTGVTKDVRMKCIEFLYFYLLPEQNDPQRAVSTSSSSSSSSNESSLFPPSPLSTSQNSIDLPKIGHAENAHSPPGHPKELADLDMPFVPMTPRKAPQPNLGYLTPATRKSSVCTSNSSTPSLPTVPASPRVPISQSSTSRGLAAMLDEMDSSSMATPRSSRSNRITGEDDKSGVGLGLGLPKNTSGIVRSKISERTDSTAGPGFIDPFNLASTSERSHSGSSGSSTIVPSSTSRSISRSSTQPSLTLTDTNGLPRSPSISSVRRSSVRRVSKSPLIQSNLPEEESVPRTPKIRHSRTQSHLSGLPSTSNVPPVPPLPQSSRTPSSKPRAFPAELTRGIPPSASSPSLGGVTPLGASKRIPSDKRNPMMSARKDTVAEEGMKHDKKRVKDVRSVDEKKEMLGMWLGNVEQLVQGVEKVSFWGSIGNKGKAGR